MMREDALLRLRLPRRPDAALAARMALASVYSDRKFVGGTRLADAQLLLSELITNAVREGDGEAVELCVRATATIVRVEVANRGTLFDPAQPRPPSGKRIGGWGLRLVDVIARRWGVDPEDGGVRVWFEIDHPQPQPRHG